MKNTTLKNLSIFALATAGFLVTANAATAATMTTPIQTRIVESTEGDFTTPNTFDKFDESLGTLQSVHIFLSATASSEGNTQLSFFPGLDPERIYCVSSNNCTGSLVGEVAVELSVQGGPSLTSVLPFTTQTFSNLSPGASILIPQQSSTENTGGFLIDTDVAVLDAFTGAGEQIALDFAADADFTVQNDNGNALAGLKFLTSGKYQVFYTYETPDAPPATVPEHSSVLALGIIGGLATLAKKKKQ
ncbi:MAG: choice-of-anchor E domain-containing protein [Cyanobacteria bacterium P01_G01_bin.49]